MIILGIDPGLRHTGWGVIRDNGAPRKLDYIASGVIHPSVGAGLADRLHNILRCTRELAEQYRPDECAVEETIVNMNMRASLHLAHARAAAICGVRDGAVATICEYSPASIKKAVGGAGDKSKDGVFRIVKALLGNPEIEALDASDALACAITHALKPRIVIRGEGMPRLVTRSGRIHYA